MRDEGGGIVKGHLSGSSVLKTTPMAFEAVPLFAQRFSGYFGANSMTSREA